MQLPHPRLRARTPIGVAAVIAALTLALAGCTPAVDQPSGGGEPLEGGDLTVVQSGDFQPGIVLGGRAGNYTWIANVFETMITIDPQTDEPKPLIVTEWELADDRTSATLTIRDDVTFHTGRPMTADDVKWTFEKSADPAAGSQVGFIAKQFSAIDVLDATTLRVTFAAPIPERSFLDYLSQTAVVDQRTYDSLADGSQVVGTGPFVWSDYEPGVSVTLTKYADYRTADDVVLDSIQIEKVSDSTALLSAVRSGRAQIGYNLSPSDVAGFADNSDFEAFSSGGTIYPFGVDTAKPPFDDVRVRQALQYAIDRDRINEQVYAGEGLVTNVYWGANAPGMSEDLTDFYSYDPDRAAQLIKEAGAEGTEVPITVVALPPIQSEYEIIANNLEAIGLKPTAVSVDETTFNSLQNQATLDAGFLLIHGQVGFGETTMLSSLPPLRPNNPSHFASPEYDDLRADLLVASEDEYPQALADLTEYLVEQAWTVPILQVANKSIITTDVHDVAASKRGFLQFANTYFTE